MDQLTIEICSPVFRPVSHDAVQIELPGEAGIFTVLPGHTPLLTTLGPGVVIVHTPNGEKHFYAVEGGFAEVGGDSVRVLADDVVPSASIDRVAAKAEHDRAAEGMKKAGVFPDPASAERALIKARAWLQAADRQDY